MAAQHDSKQEEVTVVRATAEDVRSIVHAYDWLFSPPGTRPEKWDENRATEALGRVMMSQTSTALAARRNGVVVGFCTVYLDIESIRFGRRAWVEDLAVHPDFRSRGVGKLILDAAKAWAKSRGASHLSLESGERRIDAHRFYERENPSRRSRSFRWEL